MTFDMEKANKLFSAGMIEFMYSNASKPVKNKTIMNKVSTTTKESKHFNWQLTIDSRIWSCS